MTNPINSKDRTYNWQLQPYISWKGNNYNISSLSNARPETNGSWKKQSSGKDGNAFLPRPMKHWRKQLSVNSIRGGTPNISIQDINMPGLYTLSTTNKKCCDISNNSSSVVSDIQQKYNPTIYDNSETVVTQSDVSNCWNGPIGKRICCNPEANLITYKTTPLEKNYISYSYYLKNRCYTYNQNISTTKVIGNTYFNSDGMATYPSEFPNGCQVLHKKECSNDCCRCHCETNGKIQDMIYKPNNRQFAKQGATSSRSRTNALKVNTIDQGGALFNNANGLKQINTGICGLNGDSLYYVKTKPVVPTCYSICINNIDPTEPAIDFFKINTDFITNTGISVSYGNNIWMAAGMFDNTSLARSIDGINWTTSGYSTSRGRNILNNGDTWVALVDQPSVGDEPSSIWYSTDNGLSWYGSMTSLNFPSCGNWIAYGKDISDNERWVAVGIQYPTSLLTSINATDWTRPTFLLRSYGKSVTYENKLWVAVGRRSSPGYSIITSTNGTNWSGVDLTSPYTQFEYDGRSVAYGNGRWVAVGGIVFTPPGMNTILYSTNGTQWLPVNKTSPYTQFKSSNGSDYYGSFVTYGNGLWVAVGKGDNTILHSFNGVDWLPVNTTSPYTQFTIEGTSVKYYDGLWVAVGDGDYNILTSRNGIDWLPTYTQFSIYIDYFRSSNPIAYGNGKWIIIGNNGIYCSN